MANLADNGGPTQTRALQQGSPAIDAGNPNGCTDHQGNPLTTDQRGNPRHGPCDMGAFEFGSCGDGILQITAGEQCDDGNQNNNDACLNTCVAASCGDGIVQTGVEGCDDNNTTNGDGCSTSCQTEPSLEPNPTPTGNQEGNSETTEESTQNDPVTDNEPGSDPETDAQEASGGGCALTTRTKTSQTPALIIIILLTTLGTIRLKRRHP